MLLMIVMQQLTISIHLEPHLCQTIECKTNILFQL